jgi:hypothetical protein
LTVTNAGSGRGTRTYDFQLADSDATLTGSSAMLLASATGIAEGPGGRTSYDVTRDLPAGRRFYWRARAIQDGTAGAWSSAFRFRTDAGANPPPVIQAITVGARAEVNADVDVTAVVIDQETSQANLVFDWSASAGQFTGTGAAVRWRAPASAPAAAAILTLTVIERYTVAVSGGGEETRENRVSATASVRVNDSPREITSLATTFIDDFLHSERTPEFCVRTFSDSCVGKQEELNDIRSNRQLFTNDPTRSSMGTPSITYYDDGSTSRRQVPPSQSRFAELLAPCRFAATSKATGLFSVATGTCQLTTVYETSQWRLCDSRFLPSASTLTEFLRLFRF